LFGVTFIVVKDIGGTRPENLPVADDIKMKQSRKNS
jgi:hypothetical protein